MANATPYCYKALNEQSYNSLGAYVVTSTLEASFFPKLLTIVISPNEWEEESFKDVGKFIDDEGLDFHIKPILLCDEFRDDLIEDETTPSCILQEIIHEMIAKNAQQTNISTSLQTRLTACENELSEARRNQERYDKWWQAESSKRTRLEETIKALRALLNVVVE